VCFNLTGVHASDLYLEINYTVKERSKDSNQQATVIKVDGQDVSYSYRYTGFPGLKEKKFKYKLSPDLMEELLTMLSEGHLDRNVEEEKPDNALGHSIELNFIYKKGLIDSKSNIKGMIRFMKTNETNLEETAFIDMIKDIIQFIKMHKKQD